MHTAEEKHLNRYRATGWAIVAAALCLCSAMIFGRQLSGYQQALHPLALLGAKGVHNALVFNIGAFVLPGVIGTYIAIELRLALPATAGWNIRIGAWLSAIAGVAFAGQGILPIDPTDLEATSTRLHGLVWTWWWLALVAGTLLIAIGAWNARISQNAKTRMLSGYSAVVGLAVFILAIFPFDAWPGVPQRLAVAAWLVWLIVCGLSSAPYVRSTVAEFQQ